ncbi:hypothetical protein HYZ05_00950 [Candidatus Daviesbacteria bacterium]|nr:hypothetical protein [Candidatus Daviesbacteria bacterium]
MSVQQLEREQLPTFYSQKAEEHASRVLETHRIPDPYYFLIDQDGDLFSPSAHLKVREKIDTSTRVGMLEAQAFQETSHWASGAEAGASAWVSPPGHYPVSKIIISEIEKVNGVKRIFNRAIVLDINESECLDLGRRLSAYSLNQPFLTYSDQLRSTPIILDTKEKNWLEIMEEVMPDSFLWESIRRGDEVIAKQAALAEAERIFAKYRVPGRDHNDYADNREMQRDMQSMLGDKPESCPPRLSSGAGQTAFQVFSENALTFSSSANKDPDFCEVCPACEEIINCVVKTGSSCPKCGAVKRCG